MQIQIITLDPSRWKENKQLRLQALQTDPAFFGRTYEEDVALPDEQWISWLKDAQERKLYLLFAECEGQLVGMVGAKIDADKQQATIITLYVDLRYRGKKISTQLMKALLEKLEADKRVNSYSLKVNMHAIAAIALYKNVGFKQIDQDHDFYIMEKSK